MRLVTAADIAFGINLNGDVQAILLQDHLNQLTSFILVYAYILPHICQGWHQSIPIDVIAGHIRVRTLRQGRNFIQIGFSPFNHPCAACRIITTTLRQVAHSIGAI